MTKKCSVDGWKTAPDSRGADMSNSRGRNAVIMSQTLKWNVGESCFFYAALLPSVPNPSIPSLLLHSCCTLLSSMMLCASPAPPRCSTSQWKTPFEEKETMAQEALVCLLHCWSILVHKERQKSKRQEIWQNLIIDLALFGVASLFLTPLTLLLGSYFSMQNDVFVWINFCYSNKRHIFSLSLSLCNYFSLI